MPSAIDTTGLPTMLSLLEHSFARYGLLKTAAAVVCNRTDLEAFTGDIGEAVKLLVAKKAPALTEANLLPFCAEKLTGYMRPRSVAFICALPKSALGKVSRRELRTA